MKNHHGLKPFLYATVLAIVLHFVSCEKGTHSTDDETLGHPIDTTGMVVEYRGAFVVPPADPVLNWVYLNTNDSGLYIYNDTSWILMISDGSDGINGTVRVNGTSGKNIFITYCDNSFSNRPAVPSGDGTLPAQWHTNYTPLTSWVSQKIASSATDGTWGPPICFRMTGGNGLVYFEGFKPDLLCSECHTPDKDSFQIIEKKWQWSVSKHSESTIGFEPGISCTECHTTEGFFQKINGLPLTIDINTTPVGCFACHSPHKKGDFSLRRTDPVLLFSNFIGVSRFSFDYGKGNLCAKCHRPRAVMSQLDPGKSSAANDSIVITTSRWFSHYGVQSQMLMGKGGYEWQNGPVPIIQSAHTSASQIKSDGCIVCHMATGQNNSSGGHTMNLTTVNQGSTEYLTTGCVIPACHPSPMTTFDDNGKITEIRKNLDTLKILLSQRHWLDTLTMTVKASTAAPLVISPSNKAGALWNYFLVANDGSEGIHNAKYANSLLRNSIAKMRGQF
ncbi:MAG: hypothetical protein WCW40_09545 [Bacteroidota bacterium]